MTGKSEGKKSMTSEGIIQAEKHGYLEVYQLRIESMKWKLKK